MAISFLAQQALRPCVRIQDGRKTARPLAGRALRARYAERSALVLAVSGHDHRCSASPYHPRLVEKECSERDLRKRFRSSEAFRLAASFASATPLRRPQKPDSEFVHQLLEYFEAVGFEGAPRFRGIDSKNREIVTYIPGSTLPHNGFRLSEDGVRAGARLVRTVHDLTEGTRFAAGSEVACHPNLSQPNFVFRDTIPVAIIDWDGTAPAGG
jgi:hypothetical protein